MGITQSPQPPVAGLPDGVALVRFGTAKTEDYEIVQDPSGIHIYKGPRIGAASGVIVEPAEGYSFRFDIKSLSYYAVKNITATNVTATVKFAVATDYDLSSVEILFDKLRSMPGFVSLDRT